MKVRPRHLNHRSFGRLRHSGRFLNYLEVQAARLSSSPEGIFENLKTATFEQINSIQPDSPE